MARNIQKPKNRHRFIRNILRNFPGKTKTVKHLKYSWKSIKPFIALSENTEKIITVAGLQLTRRIHELPEQQGIIPFFTNGKYALHHIIANILQSIGPSIVYLSAFNIAPSASDLLNELYDDGYIEQLNLYLNIQNRRKNLLAIKNLNRNIKVHFLKIHAKLCILQSEQYNVLIQHSGNLNSNDNREFGTIYITPSNTENNIMQFAKEFLTLTD